MFCPNCGAQIPDGTKFCSRCGKSLVANTSSSTPSPQNTSFQAAHSGAPQYQSQSVSYTPLPTQPKKSNKGLVIGLIAAAVVVVIVAILFFSSCVFGKFSYVGTWEGTGDYSGDIVDITLTLEGDNTGEMEMAYDGDTISNVDVDWEETDDGIRIANEGQENWDEMERDGNKLTFESSGIEIELTKQ